MCDTWKQNISCAQAGAPFPSRFVAAAVGYLQRLFAQLDKPRGLEEFGELVYALLGCAIFANKTHVQYLQR